MRKIDEILREMNAITDKVTAENREMSAEEKASMVALQTEFDAVEREMRADAARMNLEKAERENQPQRNANEILREYLKGSRDSKQAREITLAAEITNSGAVELTIQDIIPTLNEGLGLPSSLKIVTGVVGNEVWPVAVNAAEMEEVGENASLTDQKIDFDKVVPVARRTGLTIWVSNSAIDNAAFDLLGYVNEQFKLAQADYLAKKLYSQAAFTGNKGPFSGLAPKATITLANKTAYADILKAVADFTNKGFNADKVCLVMDAVTEADLKSAPKADGQGGFVIENGKCAGYDYVVSHYINTELNGSNALVATADKFLGIGYFDYEAVQQHGNVRMTVDATSHGVAIVNKTAITLNTAWSFTDLSEKVGKKGGTTTQAFALYKIA